MATIYDTMKGTAKNINLYIDKIKRKVYMPKYEALSAEVTELIERSKSTGVGTGVAFDNDLVVRRRKYHNIQNH